MASRPWRSNRFDTDEAGFDPLTNLVDIMLVFAVGLMAALVAVQGNPISQSATQNPAEVSRGKELPQMPDGASGKGVGEGYETVGRVYRDPKTGKLYLIDQAEEEGSGLDR